MFRVSLIFWTCLHVALLAELSEGQTRIHDPWKKHVVFDGVRNQTAVAGDFTGDGEVDVITACGGVVRLFVAPDWREVLLYQGPTRNWGCIHSEVMDVDRDGDLDYIAAVAKQGVFWLQNPGRTGDFPWKHRLIDDEIHGIHCTLRADIDGDGHPDLFVNNFEPHGAAPNSLTWLKVPADVHSAEKWPRFVFGEGDAPGGNHYFGVGDVNGDGRLDVAIGAKGKPFLGGNWFAWWANQGDPKQPWRKTLIAENETGATNIVPADLNGDGRTDFFATRGHGSGVVWFEAPDWTPHEVDPLLAAPHCLQVVDMDGDGDVDAATCARLSKLAVWYENDGSGHFTPRVIGTDQAAYDIRAVDMDGDADLDLLIAGESSANVVWYENPQR